MLKKLFTVTVLSLATTSLFFAAGCASDSNRGEYGLTGTDHRSTGFNQDRDQKGHYRADWSGNQLNR